MYTTHQHYNNFNVMHDMYSVQGLNHQLIVYIGSTKWISLCMHASVYYGQQYLKCDDCNFLIILLAQKNWQWLLINQWSVPHLFKTETELIVHRGLSLPQISNCTSGEKSLVSLFPAYLHGVGSVNSILIQTPYGRPLVRKAYFSMSHYI